MKRMIFDITDQVNRFAPSEDFAHWAGEPYVLFFDSADESHPEANYSFIAINPIEIIEYSGRHIHIRNEKQNTKIPGHPFDILQDRLKGWAATFQCDEECNIPFTGGAAGLFGYDLARTLEKLPSHAKSDISDPAMAIGIYTTVLAYDLRNKKIYLSLHDDSKNAAAKKAKILQRLHQNAAQKTNIYSALNWQAQQDKKSYKAKIQNVIDYIYAGDIFQANLSQRFSAQKPENFEPYSHYQRLRYTSPAPFGCYYNMGRTQIASTSPERFLSVRGNKVSTKPIKGTTPRHINPALDKQSKTALLDSEKDRAENIMIVDLLRNDISKCCTPESVKVPKLCELESFSHVHHLVSTIEGELKEDKSSIDLLRGAFPGGSITGAPKIRAMEIIDELEPSRRGPYTGSIGYIDFNGNMDTNILIRTLIYDQDQIHLSVGGGITAASDPEKEYNETLDKAQGIFASFEPQQNRFKKAG